MISIEDYVCNLIAGNTQITTLYFAVDRARDIVNKDNRFQRFNKKISFTGIGTKVYSSVQLVELENLSYRTTLSCLISQINNKPTLDQYILLLLIGRNTIRGLYQACCRANVLRQEGKVFCYTFVNPFGSLSGVTRDRLSFKGWSTFLTFFCKCERTQFNPSLVFNGLN